MPLSAGVRLGPYSIDALLGAGGMGEVYRARDTRLDRTVAIKILAIDMAGSAEFRQRFDREARTISSLDHEYICTLFDVGRDETSGVDYLVMQYVEGETLAAALIRAALPIDRTLRCAIQIAAALDAAHRVGIVHRDLKPANVMMTRSGIKLLDFGVAAWRAPLTPAMDSFGGSATHAAPLTGQGSLVGTLQYMSPEQLEGRDVDARSDIFSFGAVLFEMLTGRKAFEGQSQASVIAAILNGTAASLAERTGVQAALPPAPRRALDRLLRKCLAASPDDRWQSAGDLADELRWIDQERLGREPDDDATAVVAARTTRLRRREGWWIAATTAACLVAVAVGAWMVLRPLPAPPSMVSFVINPPDDETFNDGPQVLAVSPDGRRLAFLSGSGNRRLWIRSLDSTTPRALPGTERAGQPVWSPDSQSLLFNSGAFGQLKKIDVTTGALTTISESSSGRPAWSPAGVILYRSRDNRLMRVSQDGGDPTPATELDVTRQETSHEWPVFLSDGRRFLFLVRGANGSRLSMYLGSIDSLTRTVVGDDVQSNVDLVNGTLLYTREGTLTARSFDEKHGRFSGAPMPIVEGVQFNAGSGRAAFSASHAGVLAYRTGANFSRLALRWYDRGGRPLETVGEVAEYSSPRISSDGHRLIVARRSASHRSELWIIDLDRGISTRLSNDSSAADDEYPVWSGDGTQIFYASNPAGAHNLYVRSASGAGQPTLLYSSPEINAPTGVSRDGRFLLFTRGTRPAADIWALPLDGERKPFSVVATPASDDDAVFSPDGRWIAYKTVQAGIGQIFVQPFPTSGERIQISTDGGSIPAWSADGRQILYAAGGHLHEVDVARSESSMKPGLPRELPVPVFVGPASAFAMDPAGGRVLVPVNPPGETSPRITVVVNWRNLLRQ